VERVEEIDGKSKNIEFILNKHRSENKRLQAVWSTFMHRIEKDYRTCILTYALYTTKEAEFIGTGLRGPIICRHNHLILKLIN